MTMLDTVILTIPKKYFHISKPAMFMPNADVMNNTGNCLIKCVNNASASDKRNGIYRPRLTLIKRPTKNGSEIWLKVEFSVAKILFANNVDEVQENDFEAVVGALHKSMVEMGVSVVTDKIREASVSAFHPSKNIELTDGYTSSYVINELNKIKISKKMDLNKDSFRNSGNSLQLYTGSHSMVIYDKIQDIQTPEKRAIDKDQNKLQLSLFATLMQSDLKEILRIEVRLTKKVKLNSVMKKLGFKENPTFRDIFRKDVCQKILQNYWQELILGTNLFLFDMNSNPQTTLEKIFKAEPDMKPKKAIFLVGLWTLSKSGIRHTRSIVEKHCVGRSWERYSKELVFLDKISTKSYHKWVKQIDDAINNFNVFKTNKSNNLLCKAL